jgi:hypothetical protein
LKGDQVRLTFPVHEFRLAGRIAGKSRKLKTLPLGELLRAHRENFEIPHANVLRVEVRRGRLFGHTGRMIISTSQGQHRSSVWAGAYGGFGGETVRREFDSFVNSVRPVFGDKVAAKGFL